MCRLFAASMCVAWSTMFMVRVLFYGATLQAMGKTLYLKCIVCGVCAKAKSTCNCRGQHDRFYQDFSEFGSILIIDEVIFLKSVSVIYRSQHNVKIRWKTFHQDHGSPLLCIIIISIYLMCIQYLYISNVYSAKPSVFNLQLWHFWYMFILWWTGVMIASRQHIAMTHKISMKVFVYFIGRTWPHSNFHPPRLTPTSRPTQTPRD